jgi:YTH domain-containing family protein
MSNPNALAYASQHMQMPQMNAMMPMPMGSPPQQFSHPATMQSVMRHPSPVPPAAQQQFMNMGGVQF